VTPIVERSRGVANHRDSCSSSLSLAFRTDTHESGRYFGEFGPVYTMSYIISPMFLIGASIWALGLAINIHSDYILSNLRKPGETGYKIPIGGVFNFVSGMLPFQRRCSAGDVTGNFQLQFASLSSFRCVAFLGRLNRMANL